MAQIMMPQRRAPEEDNLSKLMKGLTIASQVYGIKTNMAQLDDLQNRQAAEKDLASGVYNKPQVMALSKEYNLTPEKPEGDSFPITQKDDGSVLYAKARKDTSPVWQSIETMRNGKAGTLQYDTKNKVEGAFFEKAPKEIGTRAVVVEDPVTGAQTTQIVKDVPGQSFAAPGKPDQKFAKLPKEAQKEVEALTVKNANKIDIANQMDSEIANFKTAYESGNQTQAIAAGEGMLKLLNSSQGADAVGVDEAKRLGNLLEFQIFNMTGKGPAFGRDLPGFYEQVSAKSNALKSSVQMNKQRIDDIYGGKYSQEIPKNNKVLGGFGSSGAVSGQALAAPAPSGPSARELLQIKANAGDKKAADYLNSLNGAK